MKIYLDTNVFFYFFFENTDYSGWSRRILGKINTGEFSGVTSCFTLEELAYVTLMKLMKEKYKKHPSDAIRENRSAISELSKPIEKIFSCVYSFENLEIAPADKKDVWFIPDIMGANLLLPRDSLQIKTMKDYGIKHIASTDSDFDSVKGVERIKP